MDRAQRKKEARIKHIRTLAEFIVSDCDTSVPLNLDVILNKEGINIYYDHYEQCFDGLLTFEPKQFCIHVDIDKGNYRGSKRSRFSIAHELGHYFIPEHHKSIIDGTFIVHPSNFKAKQTNLFEIEADSFAASLLMPSAQFKEFCYQREFSFELIKSISDFFNVSLLSSLLRFVDKDAGTYPLMISLFQNGLLTAYKQSEDFKFRNVPFKSKIGHPPPPTSAIGEYYRLADTKFKDVQEVSADDWFWINSSQKMYEQCFYSDYGYDISVLWPE
jgi:Zn-dependent peptidase ImmA (M78 family)